MIPQPTHKIVCSSNKLNSRFEDTTLPLTIDKIYTILDTTYIPFHESRPDIDRGPFYTIINDKGNKQMFSYEQFRDLTIQEKRNEKLQDLIT